MRVIPIGNAMRHKLRVAIPLVQVAIAIALTTPSYLRSPSIDHPAKRNLGLQWGVALNAPAEVSRYFLQRLAMQFCPERYRGNFTECPPLNVIFETVVYFALVWVLWCGVLLELSGGGQSVLSPRTRMRTAADLFAILFGGLVAFFGVVISDQLGPRYAAPVGITYLIWAIAIIVFYSHDLWVHLRAHKVAARGS